jgi:2-phospho-L-lactate guanylyltransferase
LTCWAVIPIKPPPDRKTRLARVLDDATRDNLVRGMAAHVATAARAAPGIDTVRFLAPTKVGLPDEVAILLDVGGGLNAAATGALEQVGLAGGTRVIIIAGDLPLVTPLEIGLLAAVNAETVAIAPDRHGVGTNALSIPMPGAVDFRFAFGKDSLAHHRREVERLGLELVEVRSEGLARDVDLPDDLADAAALL